MPHIHYRTSRRGVEAHRRVFAVEADVVAHLTIVEVHTPTGQVGVWDPLDEPTAVLHAVCKASFNTSRVQDGWHG
jgi:hypothetical protein